MPSFIIKDFKLSEKTNHKLRLMMLILFLIFVLTCNDSKIRQENLEKLQIEKICGNMQKINKISINGKKRYFSIFNNLIISDYILSKTFDIKSKYKYIWD